MSPAETYVWRPGPERLERSRVARLARAHGVDGIDALRARSVADVAWYWDAVVADLGLRFSRGYSQVLDLSAGITDAEWFVGGELNVADACLARWAEDPDARDRTAVVHEAEDGSLDSLTFAELDDRVRRVSAGLRGLGLRRGDAVALYLPMVTEAVVAFYAAARIGAVVVPLFSGFAPGAIASRLADGEVRAVVVAESTVRRGRTVAMLPAIRDAVAQSPSVSHVVVVGTPGPGETAWADLSAHDPETGPAEPMAAADTLLLAYTSGTTGKPKGAVHTHAGFLVKTASEVAYSFDVGPGGVFCWITDMGWIMGPLSIVGTHANGATLVLYEGSPDVPDLGRLWQLAERHRVTMLGVSPTLIRTIRSSGAGPFDLSSVHTLGSTGEPWDPESYEWLAREVFGGRVPIINFSGGTEVGGSFLAPYPVEPIASCSLGGPSLGMDVDVVDAAGQPVRGEIGELVCRQPWPAMTRGVWRDRERYLEAYWSTFPGLWRHGDHAIVDQEGRWFLRGRSDDVMNVAGKRLAPAEVEAVLIAHPDVAEAAVVGVPDPKKGEAVWAFWVPRAGAAENPDIVEELRRMVGEELGKPFAPSLVRRVAQLPKTRSAKIMRRAVRAAALGEDPGDLSGAENPGALDVVRAAVGRSS
ncbi:MULTISPECIES: AMP-binding protein [Pseudonocardia]|uniref:acetate--CoA ligase n=2 Tax=Pseudonocardia TaxID=1847 RepID=A0A1Y2MRG3_PSEAH|nr:MULTISPECIES: AMP-binding protein [Pseudonocardia]OSY37098.1 Acetyl-coenzyme A synthetase [Pseudonocardia autotrophica]TDN72070.1 acetyl-CoA synthetase [Pseudonocardia autotrophica]BBG02768.1 acetyl-CoA synthetase [Pseudonocardia autotrophica]GEC25899.1 acetyl-CoA synthetase [Pseudonocardia saturnea]